MQPFLTNFKRTISLVILYNTMKLNYYFKSTENIQQNLKHCFVTYTRCKNQV